MISPHVLLAAPTGSGKTQGVMLPNALTWPGSLVALDIKGELYAASAGFRAEHGQAVYRLHFTPRDYQSHQYNPFAFAARDPNFLVADVQRITSYLIQLGTGDDFWPQEARRLFIALALYCYAQNEIPTLPRIRELALVGDDGTGLQRWLKTLTSDPTAKAKLHREAMMSLVNFAVSAENTVAGIVQTLVAGLSPFLSELTGAVVSGNSAPLDRLREVPTSIYLVVQPADIEQLAPIIRLFFQQVVDLNTDREWGQSPTHRHLVLLGMDEFATIGRVPAIQHSIAFMRSYGLRLLAIVQSPAQLQAVYQSDGAKSFVDNFGCGVHFTPGAEDLTAAQTLEKLLGYRTIQGRSKARRRSASFHTGEGSETTSDQKRALMLYQDILRMPTDQLIILMSALHPIRAQKLLAMRDPRFAPRILPAPPVPTITLASAHTLLHGNTTATAAPTTPSTPQPDDTLPVVYQLDDFELELAELPATPAAATPEEIERLCHSILDRVLTPTPTRGT